MKGLLRRPSRLALAALLFLAAPALAQPAALRGLDAYVEQAMRDWDVPGLALVVVQGDRLVYARGYGVRERGRPERVDEHTVFAVASNTKALTATALGMLVSEGRLGWDDPATTHLPWLQLRDPWATRALTVRDMLTHRAGYDTWQGDLLWYGSGRSIREVVEGVRHLEPTSSFRSQYGYNNLLFIAAGEIIPAITDTSWADFIRARLLAPLGMSRTTTTIRALDGMENVARPHTLLDGAVGTVPYRDLDNGPALGALNASVRDWGQWLRLQLRHGAFEGRRLVDSAVVAETRTPQTVVRIGPVTRRLFPTTHFVAYGLGWFLRDYHGRLVAYHTGGMDGMLSMTGFLPEEDLAVAVFTNYDEQTLYAALFYEVVDRMLGLPERDWSRLYLDLEAQAPGEEPEAGRVSGTQPSLAPEGYAGTYANDVLGEARVTADAGGLRVVVPRNPGVAGPLAHWHYDTFQATWADPYFRTSLVTFTVGPDGRADTFRFRVRPDFVDPQEYTFRRVE